MRYARGSPADQCFGAYDVLHATAPLRIDCGGTWDFPALFLSARHRQPATLNIAIDRLIRVQVEEHTIGLVALHNGEDSVEFTAGQAVYTSPLGPLALAVEYFAVSGISISISSDAPMRSGLGGSAAVLVATVAALMVLTGAAGLNRMRVARIANSIESSLTVCGYQDHLSSAFGGANLWSWGVRDTQTLGGVRRIPLLAAGAVAALNRRLGVVFTGEAHDSSVTTQDWIRQYCAGTNRDEWYAANDATADLAAALADQDWTAARTALDRESRLREQCSPGAVTPAAHGFLDIARDLGCAARFAGGGGGGSVWAFGDPEDIASVVASWRNHGRCVPGSTHLSCAPTARGVHVWTT